MSAFDEIINVINKHEKDGYKVQCIRVPPDLFNRLVQSPSYMTSRKVEDADFSHEESVGLVAGKEIIVDGKISEPVANDVKLVDYGED